MVPSPRGGPDENDWPALLFKETPQHSLHPSSPLPVLVFPSSSPIPFPISCVVLCPPHPFTPCAIYAEQPSPFPHHWSSRVVTSGPFFGISFSLVLAVSNTEPLRSLIWNVESPTEQDHAIPASTFFPCPPTSFFLFFLCYSQP